MSAAGPHGPRPSTLVLAIGTATEIGKTWVGGQVLAMVRDRGCTVAARKPAQSADLHDPGPSDASVLAAATGESPGEVCPDHRTYTVAMAPPMAADALGVPAPTQGELIGELSWPAPGGRPVDVGWVETVGGPRSPIAVDGDAVTFAEVLDPDLIVLVADAGLGTVNAVLLSLAPFGERTAVVVLNRFDPDDDLHRRNRAWLEDWAQTRQGPEIVVDLGALADRLSAR